MTRRITILTLTLFGLVLVGHEATRSADGPEPWPELAVQVMLNIPGGGGAGSPYSMSIEQDPSTPKCLVEQLSTSAFRAANFTDQSAVMVRNDPNLIAPTLSIRNTGYIADVVLTVTWYDDAGALVSTHILDDPGEMLTIESSVWQLVDVHLEVVSGPSL